MTPRNFSPGEIEILAREVFRKEMQNANLVSADGIRLIVLEIFRKEIVPTHADIEEIQSRLGEFSDRLDGVTGTLSDTQNMIKRLHSFGEGQPGFFEVRAKEDDKRWEKLDVNMDRLDDNLHKFGIVSEANKIIAEKKEKRLAKVAEWSRWGVPLLAGALGASFWRLLQNYALHGGHLPPWLDSMTKILAK